jgi:hypothetical protein
MLWLGELIDGRNEIKVLEPTQAWSQSIWAYSKLFPSFQAGDDCYRSMQICGACFANRNEPNGSPKNRIIFQTRDPKPSSYNVNEFHVIEMLLARPRVEGSGSGWCPIILCCRPCSVPKEMEWDIEGSPEFKEWMESGNQDRKKLLHNFVRKNHAVIEYAGDKRSSTALWLKASKSGKGYNTTGKSGDTILWGDHLSDFFDAFGFSGNASLDISRNLKCSICGDHADHWAIGALKEEFCAS